MEFRNKPKDNRLQGKKAPKILFVGQLLLVMIMVRYGMNFCFMSFPDDMSEIRLITNTFFIIFNVGMAVLAANALLGLTSARLQSWRKVVRSAIILTIMTIFNEFLSWLGFSSTSVNFSLWFSVVLTVATLLIMFLPSIRRFYLPPMMDLPQIGSWLRYIIATPLVASKEYRFSYDDGSVQVVDVLEPDSGTDA